MARVVQRSICCPCGNDRVLALGLCATCYTLKRQDEEYFGGHREEVLARDGYRCAVPGCTTLKRGKRSIAVHHRKPGNSDPKLMITLCLACHAKVTRTQFLCREWPFLLRTLWREQHPSGHEQTILHFREHTVVAQPIPLFREDSEPEGELVPWNFTKRSDGRIAITLANNGWNFFFEKKVDLAAELPQDRFAVFITREVEIETTAIPSDDAREALKQYIAQTIASCGIKTTCVFGFANEGPGPERYGGFDIGSWQSKTEQDFYAAIEQRFLRGKGMRKSELSTNEGDAAVGAQSFFSVALTCERPSKPGPLRFARENGGAVLFLPELAQSGQALREYVESYYSTL